MGPTSPTQPALSNCWSPKPLRWGGMGGPQTPGHAERALDIPPSATSLSSPFLCAGVLRIEAPTHARPASSDSYFYSPNLAPVTMEQTPLSHLVPSRVTHSAVLSRPLPAEVALHIL